MPFQVNTASTHRRHCSPPADHQHERVNSPGGFNRPFENQNHLRLELRDLGDALDSAHDLIVRGTCGMQ